MGEVEEIRLVGNNYGFLSLRSIYSNDELNSSTHNCNDIPFHNDGYGFTWSDTVGTLSTTDLGLS